MQPILLNILLRYVRNSADAQDLVQETYLRLLTAPTDYEAHCHSPQALIRTIARRVAIDWLRRRRLLGVVEQPDDEALEVIDEGADCEVRLYQQQQLERLGAAVEQLPSRCRQVFTMRKMLGYSQRETAFRLCISENTVEQHMTKALHRLSESVLELGAVSRRERRSQTSAGTGLAQGAPRYLKCCVCAAVIPIRPTAPAARAQPLFA